MQLSGPTLAARGAQKGTSVPPAAVGLLPARVGPPRPSLGQPGPAPWRPAPSVHLRAKTKAHAAAPVARPRPASSNDRMAEEDGCVPLIWERNARQYGNLVALHDPHRPSADGSPGGLKVTYRELHQQIMAFGAGLHALGLAKGERVSLFSENSPRWLVADQGVMACGAVDCVRGSSAPSEELSFILRHSESCVLVVENAATLEKLRAELGKEDAPRLRFVVVLWGDAPAGADSMPVPVMTYSEVLAKGTAVVDVFEPVVPSASDLATLVYTSGTTGHPRGVMLTHGNLAYQLRTLPYFLEAFPGEPTLSLLPPWHIYERTTSYYVLGRGVTQVYTNVRRFKDDLAAFPPDMFVCVPLVLDTLHSRVMSRLKALPPVRAAVAQALVVASVAYVRAERVVRGESIEFARGSGRPAAAVLFASLLATALKPLYALAQRLVFKQVREAVGVKRAVISGGGSLAPHLDDFYEAVGITVLNGWGLSETSPVLACRRPVQNVRGSIGLPTPGTELKVVDPETLEPLPDGQQGLVLARGPGIMAGYWRDEAATQRVFRAGGGFFDTGDLGWRAPADVPGSNMAGMMVLSGRAKDTVVLSSGKKVEPEPLEGALCASPLIKHVVVLGQDKRELGALLYPDHDALEALAASRAAATQGASPASTSSPRPSSSTSAAPTLALPLEEVQVLLEAEAAKLNAARPDYHPFEHLAHVAVVTRPLSIEDGTLTRTMKMRRPEVMKRDHVEVEALMHRLRG